MKHYAAALTGVLAALISGIGLWSWTRLDILEIMFLMSVVYLIVPGIFLIITEGW
jgi:hypothetical protein